MRTFKLLGIILRTFGWRGLVRRGWHELRRYCGMFRSAPRYSLAIDTQMPVHMAWIYTPRGDLAAAPADRRERAITRAQKVLDGCYEAFGHEWHALPDGERWHTDVATGYVFPMLEWWKVDHLPAEADIKNVWEPARFVWVYDLIRAYSMTGNAAYASVFHQTLASWIAANPPFHGVHWSCGQETAIRALAILHAEASLPVTDVEGSAAHERILRILGWSGERIADAIGYALSQRNNHGLSEAAGLIHLGLRLRGLHPEAAGWIDLGRRLLEEQIRDQFYSDGWYAQHSFNYMRLALEQTLIVQRVLSSTGMTLSRDSLQLLSRSAALLISVVDACTGHVPNHGANDGGRVALYATVDYRDFRPVITLAMHVLAIAAPADIPLDDEVVLWLGDACPAVGSPRQDGVWTGDSGWAVARVGGSAVFVRAGSYRHRPSHLDLLHLDIRFDHLEVITDPGTYAYNAPPPWKNALTSAGVHNGPVLDGMEPAERGPHFLWYSWPSARWVEAKYEGGAARLVAECPGRVERQIDVQSGIIHIVDTVLDPTVECLDVTWLLHPNVCGERIVQAEGAEWIEAAEGQVVGWFSPSYGSRLHSMAVRVRRMRCGEALKMSTFICPIERQRSC